MAATPTPYSVTCDRPALTVSAAKPKDTFTVKIRNEGVAADTVNVGVDPGDGTTPDSGGPAVDAAWFTVEGEALPVQRAVPPGTDVLVTVTVAPPPEASSAGERIEYTFRPYVWSAIRPPRETTVHGPPTTLIVEGGKPPPWWRRYWWALAIAALVLLVAIVATLVIVLGDDPEPKADNEAPVAALDVTPTDALTWDEVTADFSRSTDPDGDPLTGSIDWGDGSAEDRLSPGAFTHSYPTPGTYEIILTLDDGTDTSKGEQVVTVSQPPFDGTWKGDGPTGHIDGITISGFDGTRATSVYLQLFALGERYSFDEPAVLSGRALIVELPGDDEDRYAIEFQGSDTNVVEVSYRLTVTGPNGFPETVKDTEVLVRR